MEQFDMNESVCSTLPILPQSHSHDSSQYESSISFFPEQPTPRARLSRGSPNASEERGGANDVTPFMMFKSSREAAANAAFREGYRLMYSKLFKGQEASQVEEPSIHLIEKERLAEGKLLEAAHLRNNEALFHLGVLYVRRIQRKVSAVNHLNEGTYTDDILSSPVNNSVVMQRLQDIEWRYIALECEHALLFLQSFKKLERRYRSCNESSFLLESSQRYIDAINAYLKEIKASPSLTTANSGRNERDDIKEAKWLRVVKKWTNHSAGTSVKASRGSSGDIRSFEDDDDRGEGASVSVGRFDVGVCVYDGCCETCRTNDT
eukprot:GHVH01008232.1.p1 GENE.GHVH01008232.1~~GHVH01008232.1.p1  ORF type:complete len:320 (+),score=42.97 GHVH01008232.1:86-1045(+)